MLLNTSHIEYVQYFAYSFMHRMSIFEIKRICHHSYNLHNLIKKFSAFFSVQMKNNLSPKYQAKIVVIFSQLLSFNGPRSAVGNVSGNRCESDCRSRGRKFDHGPVPYFRGNRS